LGIVPLGPVAASLAIQAMADSTEIPCLITDRLG